jgi:hypothetical protein
MFVTYENNIWPVGSMSIRVIKAGEFTRLAPGSGKAGETGVIVPAGSKWNS